MLKTLAVVFAHVSPYWLGGYFVALKKNEGMSSQAFYGSSKWMPFL